MLGSILNGLFLSRFSKACSHFIACLAVGLSFLGSTYLFAQILRSSEATLYYGFDWIKTEALHVPFELVLDRLSALMLLIITGIGFLIHIYAGGYLHEENRTSRFFAYLNLFVFMMLLLVLGNNLLVMFVGWEGVGLCSYLLIGYWFQKEENAIAGMKAFLVNRIGDIGFLLGIFMTFKLFGTLSFSELKDSIIHNNLQLSADQTHYISLITLCLFIGACGKSAQIPLYVWLPDAMAGPTPVSALIHAATMVTAGIYMMCRLHFFYYLAPSTMIFIAWVGGLTSFFAATIAIVQRDIKKVLAYSTVSQLGYMVLACGVGAFDASVFHLLTHACFKALLFLGAGSVIVAMHHKQDLFEMGGLKNYMPLTYKFVLVGVLAIIGFPGLSGFFSKDEILWKAFTLPTFGPILWFIGVVTAGCTAFYMVRMLCLAFLGSNRSDPHTKKHLRETPATMWMPLFILALLSIGVGYLGLPPLLAHTIGWENQFIHYLDPVFTIPSISQGHWSFLSAEYSHSVEWLLMGLSLFAAMGSAGFAFKLYRNGPSTTAEALAEKFHSIHRVLFNKYWIDEIYDHHIVTPLRNISEFLYKIIDISGINGGLNGLSNLILTSSGITSLNMTGNVRRHALVMVFGLIIFISLLVI